MPEWPKAPRARVEDFVPWVSLVYSCPLASEEEEEENELVDLVHNFGAQKCNEVPTLSGRLVLPPRRMVRRVNNHPVRVLMSKR